MTNRRIGYVGAKRNFTLVYTYPWYKDAHVRYFGTRKALLDFIGISGVIIVYAIYWRSNFNKNIMDRYL